VYIVRVVHQVLVPFQVQELTHGTLDMIYEVKGREGGIDEV
jgi:hypothetical protein